MRTEIDVPLAPVPPPVEMFGQSDAAQLDITNILSSLMKSGLVSAPSNDAATSKPEPIEQDMGEEIKPIVPTAEDLNAIKEAQADYRRRILAEEMEASLVESSVDDPTAPVPDFLYDYLSLQCQQCGVRYPDTTLGKKQLEDHLDLHFRQNRKLNQSLGRGHDRSWFTSVEDWVHEPSDSQGKPRPAKAKSVPQKDASASTAKVQRTTDLKAQYVTAHPGDEAKPMSCPICKETLQVEFLEDEEEWVWRNAVKKDDRIYHATCHAEAAASTNNLVTRFKNEIGSTTGSRGSTPEVTSRRSTPPFMRAAKSPSRSPPSSPSKLAGVKRKVEHGEPSDSTEVDQTPPLKKLALTQS